MYRYCINKILHIYFKYICIIMFIYMDLYIYLCVLDLLPFVNVYFCVILLFSVCFVSGIIGKKIVSRYFDECVTC